MFGIILLSVCTLMHLYVFGRAATVPWIKQHLPLKYLLGLGLLLWVVFYLSRALRHNHGEWMWLLEFVGMGWMGALFLLFICLLAADLVTLFGLLFSRSAPGVRGWALALGGVLSLLALVQGMRPPAVRDYSVSLKGLSPEMDGRVMVALSDMHLGTLLGRGWLNARVKQVQDLDPDLVVLAGDILDGHDGTISQLTPLLGQLNPPLGVWAVLGNHEFYRGAEKCVRLLEDAGVAVLRNRWTEIGPGLILAGVDDLRTSRRFGSGDDPLARALSGRPPGATVLLSHTPVQAEQAADAGVDLMLSGHTHNGQIWPFTYLVRRVYPLIHGEYTIQGMTAIVSRGAGTWGPRMRLWGRGEMLRITLEARD
ncbi:MAG: metallophosphoesterase [Desulfococcaceae bacterium]